MNDDRLTERLANRVFGWKAMSDRFLTGSRGWIPRWRFRPFGEIADAFRLLDHSTDHYTLTRERTTYTVEVNVRSFRGKAIGDHLPRTISVAVARALGIEVIE
jgi:hypothetical protein